MRTHVPSLGPATVPSPLHDFVAENARVLNAIELPRRSPTSPRYFELAGPREKLFFQPADVRAGIVTAGGVCPGINDVVRTLVLELHHRYGVRSGTHGFRYGFDGLHAPAVPLTPEIVRSIHARGGSFLGTARGGADPEAAVDGLVRTGTNVLFAIGGDGTMRAAHAIAKEIAARKLAIAVVGIPKTIDNDIPFVEKTFGFDTAVATARLALEAAHAEAESAPRGVALVKLMGRDAGFLAAHATLASHEVNACLVPEVPFDLECFLRWLEARLDQRGHAVVVIAEGCSLHADGDVGQQLKREIETLNPNGGRRRERREDRIRRPMTLKYIDPSYMVRALRATAEDAIFCDALARNAVHAAMAGKTDIVVGRWHRHFTHVALADVLSREKRLEPSGTVWRQVLECTGQPSFLPEALV